MGKYLPLTQWLLKCTDDPVELSFLELEDIIGFKLPPSAHDHNRWWMNDINHSQAKGWLDAGFNTVDCNKPLITNKVEFSKISHIKNNRPNKVTVITTTGSPVVPAQIIKEPLIAPINQANSIVIGDYVFYKTTHVVLAKDLPSPFLKYDRHTVNELLDKKHYSSLRNIIESVYPQFLNSKIQNFMRYLVENNDRFFLKFLNKNGNDTFCRFELTDKSIYKKRGLYLYECVGKIMYIGRCRDNYHNRFNLNYGAIQPINCYKEGRSTNTHMNSLMNKYGNQISIYLCPLTNLEEIISAEEMLIKQLQPSWNRKK